jgi:hypothetical protein
MKRIGESVLNCRISVDFTFHLHHSGSSAYLVEEVER